MQTSPAGSSEISGPPATRPIRFPRSGFTLIELIVVLAIAGLIMAVAPPLIARAIPGVELKAAARQLAGGLRFARSYSIKSRKEAVLTLNLDQKLYTVSGRTREYAIPSATKLVLLTAESETQGTKSGSIRFFPTGGSTGGRITLSIGERSYDVDVDWLTGRVRILD